MHRRTIEEKVVIIYARTGPLFTYVWLRGRAAIILITKEKKVF